MRNCSSRWTSGLLVFGALVASCGASRETHHVTAGGGAAGTPESAGASAFSAGAHGGGLGGASEPAPSAGSPNAGGPSGGVSAGGSPPGASAGRTTSGGESGDTEDVQGGSAGASEAGAGGEPELGEAGAPSGECPSELIGWAAESGDQVATTTGGGNVTSVRPTSAAELVEYARDASPRVIEIAGTFSVPSLQVSSNKTLVGVGAGATLRGGLRIRGSSSAFVRNVIIKNLRIDGSTSEVDGDAVQIHYAHHVWIDHCEVWDGADGNLDVVHGSNWVTISWSKFRYTSAAPDAQHKFSTLIGHSDDNASEDRGRLNVTLHHNHWAEGVIERMPRVRFGQVHVFNNYFTSRGNNYCVRAGSGARILAERNVFEGVKSPHQFNNAADRGTAHITARDNLYTQVTGDQEVDGGGTPFTTPPYTAPIDPASSVAERVLACAGPR